MKEGRQTDRQTDRERVKQIDKEKRKLGKVPCELFNFPFLLLDCVLILFVPFVYWPFLTEKKGKVTKIVARIRQS